MPDNMRVRILSDKRVWIAVDSFECHRRFKDGRFVFGGMVYAIHDGQPVEIGKYVKKLGPRPDEAVERYSNVRERAEEAMHERLAIIRQRHA